MHDNDSQQQQDKNPEPGDPSEDVEDARPEAAAAEPDPGAQIAELKDQLLRALAEIENVRRRGEKERADASRYAIASFARDILAVADNLQRTLDAGREGGGLEALLEAVDMTDRDLKATLERNGIKAISPLGEKFDHNFHQAMFESPGTGKPAGTVVQVLQTGYVIADRLLRPAMVGIAAAGNAAADNAAPTDDEGQAPDGNAPSPGAVDTKA